MELAGAREGSLARAHEAGRTRLGTVVRARREVMRASWVAHAGPWCVRGFCVKESGRLVHILIHTLEPLWLPLSIHRALDRCGGRVGFDVYALPIYEPLQRARSSEMAC